MFNSGFDSFIQKCVIMFHKEENKEKIEEETSTQNKKKNHLEKLCVCILSLSYSSRVRKVSAHRQVFDGMYLSLGSNRAKLG